MTRRFDRVLTRRWALAAAAAAVLILSAIGYFTSRTSPDTESPQPTITFTPLPSQPPGAPLGELGRLLVPDSPPGRLP